MRGTDPPLNRLERKSRKFALLKPGDDVKGKLMLLQNTGRVALLNPNVRSEVLTYFKEPKDSCIEIAQPFYLWLVSQIITIVIAQNDIIAFP